MKASFLLLLPWTEGQGGVDVVPKSWVTTPLCGQSVSECQVASTLDPEHFAKGHFLVVWCTVSVTARDALVITSV